MLMPFGKYKGKDHTEVMAIDPAYFEWLQAQEWFAKKYRPIYQVVVNAAPTESCTPEHNAMQALFLDADFRMRYVRHLSNNPSSIIDGSKVEMETGTDVVIRFNRHTTHLDGGWDGIHHDVRLGVECKPSLGDDYPQVLRQMHAQRQRAATIHHGSGSFDHLSLCVGKFATRGATESQVRKIFGASDFTVVRLDELGASIPRTDLDEERPPVIGSPPATPPAQGQLCLVGT